MINLKTQLEKRRNWPVQKISTGMSTGRRLQWTPPELSRSHIRAGARPETKAGSRGVLRRWQMNVNKQALVETSKYLKKRSRILLPPPSKTIAVREREGAVSAMKAIVKVSVAEGRLQSTRG